MIQEWRPLHRERHRAEWCALVDSVAQEHCFVLRRLASCSLMTEQWHVRGWR